MSASPRPGCVRLGGRNDGNACGLDVPSCCRRLQLSAFAWFVRGNRCIGVDTPMPKVISSGPAHSHRLVSPLPIGVLQSSSWVASSNESTPGPYANVGICATMGLILFHRPAHDHTVDRRSPSKHQKTLVDMSLNTPLRLPFRRFIPREHSLSLPVLPDHPRESSSSE
jgi:hypothetical protein